MEPAAGAFEGTEHVLPVRVYYEDTDLTGVVYHANYLRYFERARSDFLRLAGINHASLLARDDPAAFAVTKIAIAFHQAARIDDALEVRTRFAHRQRVRLGRSPRPRSRSSASLRMAACAVGPPSSSRRSRPCCRSDSP
jgi:acyl-CoA thioester hydrolase